MATPGEVVVWGDDTYQQITKRPSGGFLKIAPGGATQGLALGVDGIPVLWGGVGAGTLTMPIVPALTLKPGAIYTDIAIAPSFAAGIRGPNGRIDTGEVCEPDAVRPADKIPLQVVQGPHCGRRFWSRDHQFRPNPCAMGAGPGTPPKREGLKFVEVRARNDYCLALSDTGDCTHGEVTTCFSRCAP